MHKISGRTLQRWVACYHKRGLSGLERNKRSDKGKRRKISEEQIKVIRSYAIQKPPLLMSVIHKKIVMHAKEHELHIPSYTLVYQIVRTIDPAVLILAQEGSKSYRQKYELVYRREASAPNALWQADHTMLDIEILDEAGQARRPWLTIIIDDFSRVVCGYFISFSAPNAVNTALALRQAIWRKENVRWPVCGIPEILYVDNGSDFISEHIEQACLNLKIQLVHSMPGRPQGRGKIERMFKTINQKFLSGLPGHTINGKPVSSPSLNLTILAGLFEAFLHEEYHLQIHKGIGMAPLQRWKAEAFLPHLPESLQNLDILLLHVKRRRKVQRDGIKFNSLRYIDPTLVAYIGEEVEICYDPRDLAEIQVYY